MKLTIESTKSLVELQTDHGPVTARLWVAETPAGLPVLVFVAQIAVPDGAAADAYADFEADLIRLKVSGQPVSAL